LPRAENNQAVTEPVATPLLPIHPTPTPTPQPTQAPPPEPEPTRVLKEATVKAMIVESTPATQEPPGTQETVAQTATPPKEEQPKNTPKILTKRQPGPFETKRRAKRQRTIATKVGSKKQDREKIKRLEKELAQALEDAKKEKVKYDAAQRAIEAEKNKQQLVCAKKYTLPHRYV